MWTALIITECPQPQNLAIHRLLQKVLLQPMYPWFPDTACYSRYPEGRLLSLPDSLPFSI